MDQATREAFADLKADLRGVLADGFAGINGRIDDTNRRIDDLITRGEFKATIERLDNQHHVLRRDFDQHEQQTQHHLDNARADDAAVRKEVLAQVSTLKRDIQVANRWAVGSALTAAGLLLALVSWLLTI